MLVALAVLVIVLVPALFLVTGSTNVVYNNKFKVAAANLANGQLETDRNQAVVGTLPITITATPVTSTNTVTVGTETYTITQAVGWCALPLTPTTATSLPSYPNGPSGSLYEYAVLVKVTW
ncbi:MAG: hypothetical protein ACRDWB_13280, partial [Acidimicrobiales bacterium]